MADAVPIIPALRRLVVAALACAAACAGAPEPDKALATVRSWTATATLAASDMRRGAISKRLATQLHDRAVDARHGAASTLAQDARATRDGTRAAAALDSLDVAIQALAAAATSR